MSAVSRACATSAEVMPAPSPRPRQPGQGRDADDLADLGAVDVDAAGGSRPRPARRSRRRPSSPCGRWRSARAAPPSGAARRRRCPRGTSSRTSRAAARGGRTRWRPPTGSAASCGIVGADDVEPDAGRQQQLDRVDGDQQRQLLHGQARPRAPRPRSPGERSGIHSSGAGQPGRLLQRDGGADVVRRHRPGARPRARRVGPGGLTDRDVERAGGLDPGVRQRRGGEVALDAVEQPRTGRHSQNPRRGRRRPAPHRPVGGPGPPGRVTRTRRRSGPDGTMGGVTSETRSSVSPYAVFDRASWRALAAGSRLPLDEAELRELATLRRPDRPRRGRDGLPAAGRAARPARRRRAGGCGPRRRSSSATARRRCRSSSPSPAASPSARAPPRGCCRPCWPPHPAPPASTWSPPTAS